MPLAHLRFTSEDDEVLQKVVMFMRGQGKVTLAVQEVSKDGKKHIHLLIDTSKTISTCGQLLSAAFPAYVGNGSKSLSAFKKSMDHNILYCSKGTKESSPVVLFTTLDENVIEDAHKKYWLDQQKFVTEHQAEKKKAKPPSMIDRIVSSIPKDLAMRYVYLQSIYHPSDKENTELYKIKEQIFHIVVMNFGQYAKICDDIIITRHINGTLLRLVTLYGNEADQKSFTQRLQVRIGHNVY